MRQGTAKEMLLRMAHLALVLASFVDQCSSSTDILIASGPSNNAERNQAKLHTSRAYSKHTRLHRVSNAKPKSAKSVA